MDEVREQWQLPSALEEFGVGVPSFVDALSERVTRSDQSVVIDEREVPFGEQACGDVGVDLRGDRVAGGQQSG